jgi:hypothetical protein
VQFFRSASEIQFLRNGNKVTQMSQFHTFSIINILKV